MKISRSYFYTIHLFCIVSTYSFILIIVYTSNTTSIHLLLPIMPAFMVVWRPFLRHFHFTHRSEMQSGTSSRSAYLYTISPYLFAPSTSFYHCCAILTMQAFCLPCCVRMDCPEHAVLINERFNMPSTTSSMQSSRGSS